MSIYNRIMRSISDGYEFINGRKLKKCNSDQERNPITLRCIKKKKLATSEYEIIDGKLMRKCKPNQIRNPKTLRCNKIKDTLAKKPKVQPTVQPKVQPKVELKINVPKFPASPKKPHVSPKKIPSPLPKRSQSPKRRSPSPPRSPKAKVVLQECNDIKILNENNSCYLDSLLVSLFHKPNPYIYNLIFMSPINHTNHKKIYEKALEIRQELQKIYLIITGIQSSSNYQNCKSLRKMLNEYKDLYNKEFPNNKLENINWQRVQAEPSQTLQYFNIMFNFPVTSEIVTKRWGTNAKLTQEVYKEVTAKPHISETHLKSIFVHNIYNEDLQNKASIKIKDFYPNRLLLTHFSKDNLWKPSKDLAFKTKIEKISIQEAPILYIHIDRLIKNYYGDVDKLETVIVPEAQINLKNNSLKLQSIIVHIGSAIGGHYICLFKCNDKWYEFDDLSKHVSLIGSLNDVYKYNDHFYVKNCTDLIYY